MHAAGSQKVRDPSNAAPLPAFDSEHVPNQDDEERPVSLVGVEFDVGLDWDFDDAPKSCYGPQIRLELAQVIAIHRWVEHQAGERRRDMPKLGSCPPPNHSPNQAAAATEHHV